MNPDKETGSVDKGHFSTSSTTSSDLREQEDGVWSFSCWSSSLISDITAPWTGVLGMSNPEKVPRQYPRHAWEAPGFIHETWEQQIYAETESRTKLIKQNLLLPPTRPCRARVNEECSSIFLSFMDITVLMHYMDCYSHNVQTRLSAADSFERWVHFFSVLHNKTFLLRLLSASLDRRHDNKYLH